MCGCITAILRCPFPAASASEMHSEIAVTTAHTCSDLSDINRFKYRGLEELHISVNIIKILHDNIYIT